MRSIARQEVTTLPTESGTPGSGAASSTTTPRNGFGSQLRSTFPDLRPTINDVFLLEPHQLLDLPKRTRPRDLAAVIQANPQLDGYVRSRCPDVVDSLSATIARHGPLTGRHLAESEEALLWDVADWIVYQRAPELYDALPIHEWDFASATNVIELEGRTVVDGGAGTGRVSLDVAEIAKTVFAVEPVAALRAYVRRRAAVEGVTNLYVVDGFLDAIPLPDSSIDAVITCRAIGWRLEEELAEIDRVLTSHGTALHLTGMPAPAPDDDPVHVALTRRGYVAATYAGQTMPLRRYWKRS